MYKNELYLMRDENNKNGLLDLIFYINEIKPTKKMNMIEIGSYAGESTEIFAQHFNHVISIDPFINDFDTNDFACQFFMDLTNVYDFFLERIKKYSNITHIRKTSDEAISDILSSDFDFVYIDGLHTYEQVKKDILNYSPKIVSDGFIGGHDYLVGHWDCVVNAVNESLTVDKLFCDTSWVHRKR